MRPQCQKRTAKRNGESRFQFGFCHSFVFCDHKEIASSPQASFCPSREVVIHKRGLRYESALETVVHGRPSSWEAQVVGRRGRREQPVWGMEVRGAELQESPGLPPGRDLLLLALFLWAWGFHFSSTTAGGDRDWLEAMLFSLSAVGTKGTVC